MPDSPKTFEQIKQRLDEIARIVQDDDTSLDDALNLYEEAVSLGLAASQVLDDPPERAADANEDPAAAGKQGASGDSVASKR